LVDSCPLVAFRSWFRFLEIFYFPIVNSGPVPVASVPEFRNSCFCFEENGSFMGGSDSVGGGDEEDGVSRFVD